MGTNDRTSIVFNCSPTARRNSIERWKIAGSTRFSNDGTDDSVLFILGIDSLATCAVRSNWKHPESSSSGLTTISLIPNVNPCQADSSIPSPRPGLLCSGESNDRLISNGGASKSKSSDSQPGSGGGTSQAYKSDGISERSFFVGTV